MDQMTEKPKLCKCGRPRRPGQRNCHVCNAASVKARLARKEARAAALEKWVAAAEIDPDTQRRFERRFDSRTVVVLAQPGSDVPDYVGYVLGFKPGNVVVVARWDGTPIDVEMRRLSQDPGYVPEMVHWK
jgi:hypothetical protein